MVWGILFGLFLFFIFLDWLSAELRGDCDLQLDSSHFTHAYRLEEGTTLTLRFDLPLQNKSRKEQALLIYADAQLVPQSTEEKANEVDVRLSLTDSPRRDGYFVANLVKPGKALRFRVAVMFRGETTLERVTKKEELHFQLSYSYYGRTPMITEHARFAIPLNAFVSNPEAFQEPLSTASPRVFEPKAVSPIKTHIIFPGEDLGKVILHYAGNDLKPGDVVAIAESVVAIAQGRVYPVSEIGPGFWARRLNRFFQFDSSMASCYSMEMAIREVGLFRVLLGTVVGFVGKLLGRKGDFYRIAGSSVASIDDSTGTLPPFDKSVVLGPKDPDRTAEEICEKIGHPVAIVDANDLQKVDVLGKSRGIVNQKIVDALRSNPQGNDDQQTPIVIIRGS